MKWQGMYSKATSSSNKDAQSAWAIALACRDLRLRSTMHMGMWPQGRRATMRKSWGIDLLIIGKRIGSMTNGSKVEGGQWYISYGEGMFPKFLTITTTFKKANMFNLSQNTTPSGLELCHKLLEPLLGIQKGWDGVLHHRHSITCYDQE